MTIQPGTYFCAAHDSTITIQIRDDGKIGVTNHATAGKLLTNHNRQAMVRWYKPTSPNIKRLAAALASRYSRV